MNRTIFLILSIFLACSFSLVSCVSVSPDAPKLSSHLGSRIVSAQNSHEALISSFFDQRRELIETFITEEYSQIIIEETFEELKNSWETIVKENNVKDRDRFFLEVTQEIGRKKDNIRAEMLAPINQLEAKLRTETRKNYSDMLYINGVITALLSSASEIEDKRNELLGLIGIEKDEISEILTQVDSGVGILSQVGLGAESKISDFCDFFNVVFC